MSLRNAEVVQAMGMMAGLLQRWGRDRNRMIERQVYGERPRRHDAEHHPVPAPGDAVGHPRASARIL